MAEARELQVFRGLGCRGGVHHGCKQLVRTKFLVVLVCLRNLERLVQLLKSDASIFSAAAPQLRFALASVGEDVVVAVEDEAVIDEKWWTWTSLPMIYA
jgi:hypothetical protein